MARTAHPPVAHWFRPRRASARRNPSVIRASKATLGVTKFHAKQLFSTASHGWNEMRDLSVRPSMAPSRANAAILRFVGFAVDFGRGEVPRGNK